MVYQETDEVRQIFHISDNTSIINWVFNKFRQPKKENCIRKHHMSILGETKIYPKPMSNDFNPCRIVTIQCDICHETHKLRTFYNGVSWKQVRHGHICSNQKNLHNTTTPQTTLDSIDRSKIDGNMKGNIGSTNISFELNDQNSMDDNIVKEKWDDRHIEKNKNIDGLASGRNVFIDRDKKKHRVRFNENVEVKIIETTEQTNNARRNYLNQRNVTFTSNVEIRTIPSRYELF